VVAQQALPAEGEREQRCQSGGTDGRDQLEPGVRAYEQEPPAGEDDPPNDGEAKRLHAVRGTRVQEALNRLTVAYVLLLAGEMGVAHALRR
jgi:hypothetical protein